MLPKPMHPHRDRGDGPSGVSAEYRAHDGSTGMRLGLAGIGQNQGASDGEQRNKQPGHHVSEVFLASDPKHDDE